MSRTKFDTLSLSVNIKIIPITRQKESIMKDESLDSRAVKSFEDVEDSGMEIPMGFGWMFLLLPIMLVGEIIIFIREAIRSLMGKK